MTIDILAHEDVASAINLLSAWIEAQMAYRGQPGLSIGLVYDQELIWAKGFGWAAVDGKVEATPQTIYRIASITKLFTSTAILQLREAGKLQLDDPVTRHLPWFKIQNRYPEAPPITIRHLLTHTSGLPREAPFPYWSDSNFPSREQVREALGQQTTILPAETKWKYSNLALTLAGEIVAAVSGQPYPVYIRQQILDPLGMNATYVESIKPDQPQLAAGYGRRLPDGSREISPYTDCQGITPAANMASTVEDLARFASFHLAEAGCEGCESILRRSTVREMQRVHWLAADWQQGKGLGFHVTRWRDKTYVGHGGALRGYRTEVQLCPADKIAVIVLTNADDGNPSLYVEKAFAWAAPAISKAAAPKPEEAGPPPNWEPYLGKYRDAWGDLQILKLNGDLMMLDPSQPDPLQSNGKLIPAGEHTFRLEASNGFMADGELVIFEMDDQNRVSRLKIGDIYTYPVAAW